MIGRRKGSSSLTQLELRLMESLWQRGASTVQEVHAGLGDSNPLAYTTVQTVLNTLERKGKLKRRLDGRAFVYEAVVSKDSILKQAIHELAERMFGGSSEELVMNLIKIREIDPARIAKLSKALAKEKTDE